MIRVLSQSDFAARTDEFINFCKAAARYAYAANTETWTDVVLAYPEIEMSRISLQTTLREKIEVDCDSNMGHHNTARGSGRRRRTVDRQNDRFKSNIRILDQVAFFGGADRQFLTLRIKFMIPRNRRGIARRRNTTLRKKVCTVQ
ncbi:unnamed protein product [Sphagnum tenellum]